MYKEYLKILIASSKDEMEEIDATIEKLHSFGEGEEKYTFHQYHGSAFQVDPGFVAPVVDGEIVYGYVRGPAFLEILKTIDHHVYVYGIGMVVVRETPLRVGGSRLGLVEGVHAEKHRVVPKSRRYVFRQGGLSACASAAEYGSGDQRANCLRENGGSVSLPGRDGKGDRAL